MSLNTTGIEALKLKLMELAFAPVLVEVELQACARELRDKSRDMAPIDYGDLKRAIQDRRLGSQTRSALGQFVKGESSYEVFINNRTSVEDPKKKAEFSTVGEYAWEVHEYMGWAGNLTSHMPSQKSVDAGRAAGVDAGGKFMERAALELMPKVNSRLITVFNHYVNSLDI